MVKRSIVKGKKAARFDPAVFFSNGSPGPRYFSTCSKSNNFRPGRSGGCSLLHKKRKSQSHRCLQTGEGGGRCDPRSGQIRRRRMLDRSAKAPGNGSGNDRLPDHAGGIGRNPSGASRRTRIFANVHLTYPDAQCAGRGRSCRSAVQFDREAPCQSPFSYWPTSARKDGRSQSSQRSAQETLAEMIGTTRSRSQSFHEQVSSIGLH